MAALRAFLALPRAERVELIQLTAALPWVRASLAVLGTARTQRGIERLTGAAAGAGAGAIGVSANQLQRAQRAVVLAKIAGRRGPLRAACLPQALAVYALLRARGYAPTLCLGVPIGATQASFSAHAWLEIDGVALEAMAPHRRFDAASGASINAAADQTRR